MKTRAAFAVATLLAAQPALAQKSAPPTGWPALTQLFDNATTADSIVGSGILIMRDGHVIAHHEHGFADRASGVKVDTNTIFHYASITKTMTAIAIMQLRDRGKLTLDDRAVDYIPELRLIHDPYGSIDSVTIRMLLSHAAGFMGPTWPYKQGLPWEPFEPTTWNQLVAMMPYQEIEFKPGSKFSYSNPGYIYLGRIIEKITGDPWENYIQKNILSPLGMTRSYFGVTPYYLAHDRSHNYTLMRDSATGRVSAHDNGADFDPGITIPNGGWNAPLSDVAKYLAFLSDATHGDTTTQRIYNTVLKHSSLEEMWKPVYPTNPKSPDEGEWLGLSFFVRHHGPTTFIGHTGGQAGFTSFIYVNPKTGEATAAAFNTIRAFRRQVPRQSAFDQIREAVLDLID